MARARNIKPGFFTNENLAEVPALGRILFQGLWCYADREGRLEDRPRKLKVEILPYDDCNIDELLEALALRGFIRRYKSGENSYIQVVNFCKHQNPHVKENASSIPAPEEHQTSTVQELELPEQAGLIPDSLNLIPDSKKTTGASAPAFSADDLSTAHAILTDILALNPNHKPPNIHAWAKTIRLMRERDKRPLQEIQALWRWAHAHHFWRTNILSPDKLRQQWDRLTIQRNTGGTTHAAHQPIDNSAVGKVRRANAERERNAERQANGAVVGTSGGNVRPPLDV